MTQQEKRTIPLYTSIGFVRGERVTYTYGGIQEGLIYIRPFMESGLFKGDFEQIDPVQVDVGSLEGFLSQCTSDIIVVAAPKELLWPLPRQGAFIMPFRIHQAVHTGGGWEAVMNSMSKREVKRHAKFVQSYQYAYHVTQRKEDFEFFYDEMHKPTMEKRYGRFARSVEKQQAYETLFKRGVLFLVTSGGRPVAGSISQIDQEKRWLNARLIGVLRGEDHFRLEGAQNAVYHSILHWACHEGALEWVDFQGCEPFLTKGTFQYKKRFATRAILPPNVFFDKRLWVRVRSSSMAVRQYLIDNPVILATENDELGAGYFYDDGHPPRLDIPYQCEGMAFERLLHLDRDLSS